MPGIGLTQENQRQYPNDNLAAHVLGFTGIDSQGLDGMELIFDSFLKGRAGSIVVEYDSRAAERFPMQITVILLLLVEGNNIYLIIDAVIQKIVKREIERAMLET